ncbi:sigma 54-interacting transcriptional regulator [Pseudomonas aeruginosa]|uniref:sigma 54-interacting transcriptional regulator n=1 Tax=Pseudomonas aeruginosa TaxID=287 RepID=UPI003D2C7FE7
MWRETKLLLIDDNLDRSRDLAVILNFLGEDQLTCNSEDWREVAAGLSNSREALCVLLGSVESKGGAVELLKQLASWDEYLPILLIGEPAPADWPEELRRRVLASLEMPPSYNKLLDSLHRAQVYREMYDQARERGRSREPNLFRSLVGTSRAIQQVRQMMQQVADTDASVLILGESGTGKEVVARNLHYHSKRREGPFVPVNCGSIRFNSAAIMSLCRHDWPGNVRELANLVERLAIMHPYGVIGVGELPKKFRHVDDEDEQLASSLREELEERAAINAGLPGMDAPAMLPAEGLDLKDYLANLEQGLIQQALDDAGGVVARAAERLRIRRTTLVEKMRKYGMSRRDDDLSDD